MAAVTCKDGYFIYTDSRNEKVLLDLKHFMTNKSRYPMQQMSDGKTGIFSLLVDLKERHGELSSEEDVFPFYLLDIIATSYLIRSSVPLKVLELGSTSGITSYHLAALMGKLNRESHLCCVSNVIGNNSENHWLDRISLVEETPNLSILISDYEATQLETDHFDIVVLNGTEYFEKPYETVREAERLVKKNGFLLCHVKNAPLLESCFKLVFPKRQEYVISPLEMILAVTNPETSWKQDKPPSLEKEISILFQELRQTVNSGCRADEIRPFIRRIDEYTNLAVKYSDIERKVKLIHLKGIALDYMLNIGKEFEEYYRNALLENLVP